MTVGLARALGPDIRVNAIAPGLVETPWLQNGLGPDLYAASVENYKSRAALAAVMQSGRYRRCRMVAGSRRREDDRRAPVG